MTDKEKNIRGALLIVFIVLTGISSAYFFISGSAELGVTALATIAMLFIPIIFEKLLDVTFSLPVFIWGLFYCTGAMLGHSFKLYYIFSWWDGMLHFFGGIAFALVGWLLPGRMGVKCSKGFNALFAVVFSMAVALGWEFIEYAADSFLGRDMQSDTFIYNITSFLLNPELGKMGSIDGIGSVTVNDSTLLPGLIDIGLIDTMTDTLVESFGALITALGLRYFGERLFFTELKHGQ